MFDNLDFAAAATIKICAARAACLEAALVCAVAAADGAHARVTREIDHTGLVDIVKVDGREFRRIELVVPSPDSTDGKIRLVSSGADGVAR